jgi:hypothetical protein
MLILRETTLGLDKRPVSTYKYYENKEKEVSMGRRRSEVTGLTPLLLLSDDDAFYDDEVAEIAALNRD